LRCPRRLKRYSSQNRRELGTKSKERRPGYFFLAFARFARVCWYSGLPKYSLTDPAMQSSDSALLPPAGVGENKPRPLTPPSPTFWRTYSPNGEFPFSSIGSFLIHGLALVVLLGGIVAFLSSKPRDGSIPIGVVAIGPPGPIGGGAQPDGIGTNPGILSPTDVGEPLVKPVDPKAQLNPSQPEFNLQAKSVRIESDVNPRNKETNTGDKNQSRSMPNLSGTIRGVPGKGRQGPGYGPGDGPSFGGRPTEERQQRWRMIFNTRNGNDYLRQLNALGAILRVDKKDTPYLIRNLSERPARPVQEDPNALQRIYWVDDDLDSRESIAVALQLGWTPERIFAYFPQALEEKLVQKELEYGRIRGRTKEEEIVETHFKIEFARGAPVITVVYQEGKK